MTLTYCPTDLMWADILTKPLQGSKFRLMRAFLMNCSDTYSEDLNFVPLPSPIPIPMKPRILQIAASPRECVETEGLPTKVLSNTKTRRTLRGEMSLPRALISPSFAHPNPYRILTTTE